MYDGSDYGIKYSLKAVVVHQGRLNFGHYVAYIRVRIVFSRLINEMYLTVI